jgi:hypothetical protein
MLTRHARAAESLPRYAVLTDGVRDSIRGRPVSATAVGLASALLTAAAGGMLGGASI